jgi:hypothetical protein
MKTIHWLTACVVLLFAACCYADKKPGPTLEYGTVVSQEIATTRNGVYAAPVGTATIAVPIYGRSNVVVVDTESTRYKWSEATRRGTIVLTVNAPVEFYRDGNWFIVLDSKGGKHRFALIGAIAKEQRPTTGAKLADVFTPPGAFPARWHSFTNGGGTRLVRLDGDKFYYESVLSDELKRSGCSAFADLRKQGDIYAGAYKYSCVCQYTKLGQAVTRRFSREAETEITLLTPTRIEGRQMQLPQDATLNCEEGIYSVPAVWKAFTWAPE